MKKNILLTGITGNLGSYFARKQLEDENVTIYALCRSDKVDVMRRIKRGVNSFGPIDEEKMKRIIPKKVNIVDENEAKKLFIDEKIDETWHFASSLKYLAKDFQDIYNVNIIGLNNVINIHKKFGGENSKFYYISTAYIGGKNFEYVEEKPIRYNDDMIFNNEYERTKLMAENIVMDCVEDGMNANILRPSVVIGDKNEGKLINYHGYYLGIKAMNEFKKYHERCNVQDSEFRINGKKDATTNIIPIDDCIDIMLKIAATNPPSGKIFNIVNKKGVTFEQMTRVASDMFGIKFICCDDKSFEEKGKSKHEKMLAFGTTYVMPYCKQTIEFDVSNLRELLGYDYVFELNDEQLKEINQQYINKYLN